MAVTPIDQDKSQLTDLSNAFPLNRRQVLGGALAGIAAAALPSSPLLANTAAKKVDVLLIGGGIMSATLGVWLRELEPTWSMQMLERLDGVALESSNGWNNAGTGHSALAEPQLHAGRRQRQHQDHPGRQHQRILPDFPAVLGLAGAQRRLEEPALLHQPHAAYELRLG